MVVGNGEPLEISQIGNTLIHYQCDDTLLVVKNVCAVPDMQKNRLSIKKLTFDSPVVLSLIPVLV